MDSVNTPASEPVMVLSLEALKTVGSLIPSELVYIPQLNGHVRLRGLTFGDYCAAGRAATRGGKVDKDEQQRQTLVAGFVEPKLGPEHAAMVNTWPIKATLDILEKIMSLSGMDPKDPKDKEVLDPDSFSKPRSDA